VDQKSDNIGIDRCSGMLQVLLSILIAMLIQKIPNLAEQLARDQEWED
jgi:hypothetical protein